MEKLVNEFLNYVKDNNLPLEALVLSNKDGIIIREELTGSRYRNIYSHTKSFVTIACLIAVSNGKLSLSSRLVDSIKEMISKEQYKKFYDVTLDHLLNMTSGIGNGELFNTFTSSFPDITDYVSYLMNCDKVEAGTRFKYSNADTYLAALMLEKAVGSVQEFMYLNIFKKMDIPYPIIATCPKGHIIGATGLVLNIEHMNKMGVLMLNKGMYKNTRILDGKYIDMIEKLKINTGEDNEINKRYGYNFWGYKGGYRADGAFGQITFIFPKNGYALSIQCPENGNLPLVMEHLNRLVFGKYLQK